MEIGTTIPSWEEAIRLAQALRVPLQRFLSGKLRPAASLEGIALELHDLGIRDFVVAGSAVPGAFRRAEQVIALALRGDRPETRVIDAIPYILATQTLNAGLALAFADCYDRRLRVRLAWLCEVTLLLGRFNTFPVPILAPEVLEKIAKKVKKPIESDDLGHPSSRRASPLWRRWNITYAGTVDVFIARARELAAHDTGGEAG